MRIQHPHRGRCARVHSRDMGEDFTEAKIKPPSACYICGDATMFACSDCRIDFGVSIHVCEKPSCRDEHEKKCSFALRRRYEAQ